MYNKDTQDLGSKPMERNYQAIWQKYTQYDETNTLMVSNHYNQIEEFKRNDLVIPEFSPNTGNDFFDDKYLLWAKQYITMLGAFDDVISDDVRVQMEALTFEMFIKRTTRNAGKNFS